MAAMTMTAKSVWTDLIPERDGVKCPINDIAISPDSTRVVIAVGNRVLFYNAENGNLIDSLRGHKDTVYCVSFSSDGSRFASGGADNIVVIWKGTGQGLLKYNHTSPIQKVVYCPTSHLLASCSEMDVGLWTPDQKSVTKEKVPSRITAAAWSADGKMLGLGMLSGMISVRNQKLEELVKFERRAPIWCMTFLPDVSIPKATNVGGKGTTTIPPPENTDLLAIGCWDKTYSLYRVQQGSSKLQTERSLKYYPCSMLYASNPLTKSGYLIIGGSNRRTTLYSREGVKLIELISKEDWMWCAACHGESDSLVTGSCGGAIDFIKMDFDTVDALYRDRYAYRENLTDVVVHHLTTDKRIRIKVKDLIRNLAMYSNKLAVQLSDRVCIYECSMDDTADLHFRIRKEKVYVNVPNLGGKQNLMGVTSAHFVMCLGCVVELYAFNGQRMKVWMLESPALCMRVDGGPPGKEGILFGCSNGSVHKVYVDNPFSLQLAKQSTAIHQLDINIYRDMLATVDSNNIMNIMDLGTQETLYSVPSVVRMNFNTEVEGLACVTGLDLSISVLSGINDNRVGGGGGTSDSTSNYGRSGTAGPKPTGSAPLLPEVQDQHLTGRVLGFRGQKIFYLGRAGVAAVDVPQEANIQRALDSNDIVTAYNIACLGATEADWRLLAMRSLRANYLHVAKNAFARLKDTKFLSLIDAIERRGGTGVASTASKPQATETTKPSSVGGRLRATDSGKGGAVDTGRRTPSSVGSNIPPSIPPLESSWLAELLAYEGHHQEAAKVYARAGKVDESIRLLTDLRRWEDAKMFARNAGQTDISNLTIQQAKWLEEVNDWKGSSELFVSLGQYENAAKIIVNSRETGWEDALLEVVRACPADSSSANMLTFCGDSFSDLEDINFAKEAYTKAKDITKLMALYAKRHMWKAAAALADENEGKFDVTIFLSYAEWLISKDRYEDAMQAYKKSKRLDLSCKVLQELTENAVGECRFKDAAYYYWMLSKETESDVPVAPEGMEEDSKNNSSVSSQQAATSYREKMQKHAALQYEYEHKADLYYAYAHVHSFVNDPFTSHQPEMLFQVSRFIINSLGSADIIPQGLSKACTLYTLARQAMSLGAFKLARHAYDRLSKLQLPVDRKGDEVEVDMLLVQAKPVRDDPDHLPVCYRCGSTNPLLNPFNNKFAKGDICTNCGHPFVRSFINFDILPLVEFVPEPSITDEEAIELIRQQPSPSGVFRGEAVGREGKLGRRGDGWKESKSGGADTLTLDDGDEKTSEAVSNRARRTKTDDDGDDMYEALGINNGETDLFTRCLNLALEKQKNAYTPVKVDADTLLAIKRSEVFVCRPSSPNKRSTFYRNMLPDIPIAISQPCHRFFHLEDFEFAYLSEKKCPYSRLKNVGEYGSL